MADGQERPGRPGGEANAGCDGDQRKLELKAGRREVEVVAVQTRHVMAERAAHREAQNHTHADHDADELEVVGDDRVVAEAERLQGRDLLTLRGDLPAEHHI